MAERIGIILMNFGALETALHLPEGHRIRGLRLNHDFSDTFEIAVEGPSLPIRIENCVTERVSYSITVTENRDEMVPKRTFTGKFEEKRQ